MAWLTFACGDPYGPYNKPFLDPGRDYDPPEDPEEEPVQEPWTDWQYIDVPVYGEEW